MLERRLAATDGSMDGCVRLHASHGNAVFSALLRGSLASDRGLKREAKRRTEQELSSERAACRARQISSHEQARWRERQELRQRKSVIIGDSRRARGRQEPRTERTRSR